MMRSELLAWAAGFFEGEGSIGIYKMEKGKPKLRLCVAISQADPEPLDRLIGLFGGGKWSRRTSEEGKKKAKEWSDSWMWRLYSGSAVRCLLELRPYCTRPDVLERIKVAEEFQQFQSLPQSKHSADSRRASLEDCRGRMLHLNQRGKKRRSAAAAR